MTARVSAVLPSLSHALPPLRIMAGIEASTITSEGTWRLVMPRSELTMDRPGPSAISRSKEARISEPFFSASSPASTEPRPSFGDRPASASAFP